MDGGESMKFGDVFKERIYNVSNFLSFGRMFLLIPFYLLNYEYVRLPTWTGWAWLAVIIFVTVATDFLDGFLARRWNQQTKLGRYLDPVSDKTVTIGSLFALVRYYDFPAWVFALFVLREVVAVWGGSFLFFRRNMMGAPNLWGKVGVGLVALSVLWYVTLPISRPSLPEASLLAHPEYSAYALVVVIVGGVFAYGRRYWGIAFGPDSQRPG